MKTSRTNKTIKAAALMLALTLITSCFVGGTFAKYVTSDNAEDCAQVARWGVNFYLHKLEELDLFTTSYESENDIQSSSVSVKTETDKLVAPGTYGHTISFGVTHQKNKAPEVSYLVTFDITDGYKSVKLTQGTGDSAVSYEPIWWTVNLGGTDIDTNSIGAAVDAIEAYKFYYDVDTGLYYEFIDGAWETTGENNAPCINISWAWWFEDDYNESTCSHYDTILGDVAAGLDAPEGVTVNTEISIELTATATQLD